MKLHEIDEATLKICETIKGMYPELRFALIFQAPNTGNEVPVDNFLGCAASMSQEGVHELIERFMELETGGEEPVQHVKRSIQ